MTQNGDSARDWPVVIPLKSEIERLLEDRLATMRALPSPGPPDQSAAIEALTAALDRLAAAIEGKEVSIVLNVPEQEPPTVVVEVPEPKTRKISVNRGRNGLIAGMTVEEEQ